MAVIIFNGKTYNSLDEMPANEREAFQQLSNIFVDKNGNGIPDFLEGDMVNNVMTAFTSSVNFNGQTYSNLNELPPDVREKVQGAFDKLTQMGIVTPDSAVLQHSASITMGREPAHSKEPALSQNYSPTIQEDNSSPFRWLAIGFGIALCLGLAVTAIMLTLR